MTAVESLPHAFSVILTSGTEAEQATISGEFPGSEWRRLLGFKQEAERLWAAACECDSFAVSFDVRIDQDGEHIETKVPSERDQSYLLLRLRPFILKGEPYEFTRTVATINRYCRHPLVSRGPFHLPRGPARDSSMRVPPPPQIASLLPQFNSLTISGNCRTRKGRILGKTRTAAAGCRGRWNATEGGCLWLGRADFAVTYGVFNNLPTTPERGTSWTV